MSGTYTGRRRILSQYTSQDLAEFANIAQMINTAMEVHNYNGAEIQYLQNYHLGIQPILEKEKTIRPEINNKTVINHAWRISRTITGYFLGTPIQYIDRKGKKKEQLDELNDILSFENKDTVDKEIGDDQSICGTAFRIILADSDDEIPFEDRRLNPINTFVIYNNSIKESPLAGVTYRNVYDEDGNIKAYTYFIYTDFGLYIAESDSKFQLKIDTPFNFTPYNVGGVPIIEYPNNMWRVGDWEMTLSIMDTINALYSGRIDDIEQVVQSLLVFINADIDSDTYDEMREGGVVLLKNDTQNKADVKTIVSNLDQQGMNMIAKELESLLDSLAGVPSRDKMAGGGADTGQAVELRDGWADLEIVARNKELSYKRSEKMTLKIILQMLKNKGILELGLRDIDIKFTRNKNHNLLVKTQSYSTLIATETIAPADALAIVDVVTDENEYIERGEQYWDGRRESDTQTVENTTVEENPIGDE